MSIGRASVKKTTLEAKKQGSDNEGQEHIVVVLQNEEQEMKWDMHLKI